jgi:PAS domain S-box-containing protein
VTVVGARERIRHLNIRARLTRPVALPNERGAAEAAGSVRMVRRLLVLDGDDHVSWASPGSGVEHLDDRSRAEPLERSLAGNLEGLRAALAQVRMTGQPARSGGLRWIRGDDPALLASDAEVFPGPDFTLILRVAPANDGPVEPTRPDLFREAFLHSSSAMEIIDRAGRSIEVNPAYVRISGDRPAESPGPRPGLFRGGSTPPATEQALWSAVLDPARGAWQGELVHLDRWGREHPILLTVNGLRDPGGEVSHLVGVATDLSEWTGLQHQTLRTERLASMGQLAAGVAHELNTPLANILLIAESIQRRAPNPWVAARAASIAQQVDSAATIVAGLLEFGRDHPAVVREEDLGRLVDEAVGFVGGKRSVDVQVERSHDASGTTARVNRVQFVQVIVNLVNNAYDAMEGRGRLTIRTRTLGAWVEVEVQDSGPGVLPEVLPHLFEPFYTTKSEGKGTGLGLSICHGIVHAHGGTISVRSPPGEVATFVIRLPSAPAPTPMPVAAGDDA